MGQLVWGCDYSKMEGKSLSCPKEGEFCRVCPSLGLPTELLKFLLRSHHSLTSPQTKLVSFLSYLWYWPQGYFLISLLCPNLHLRIHFLGNPTCDKKSFPLPFKHQTQKRSMRTDRKETLQKQMGTSECCSRNVNHCSLPVPLPLAPDRCWQCYIHTTWPSSS